MNTDEIAHRLAIRDVIDRFSLGVTIRDAAALAALFVESGAEWRVGQPTEMHFSGAKEIAEGIVGGLNHFEFLVQMAHSVVIELAGDRAKARSVIQEIGRLKGGSGGAQIMGLYNDEFQRDAKGWRFVKRYFQPICVDMSAPAGIAPGA